MVQARSTEIILSFHPSFGQKDLEEFLTKSAFCEGERTNE